MTEEQSQQGNNVGTHAEEGAHQDRHAHGHTGHHHRDHDHMSKHKERHKLKLIQSKIKNNEDLTPEEERLATEHNLFAQEEE